MSTVVQAGAQPATLTRRCVLNRTGNTTEILQLRPLEALPGCVELQLLSLQDDAADPQAERVRYRSVLPLDALRSLHAVLAAWPGIRGHREG